MEKIPLNKRESPVSKVVGVSPENEAVLLDFFKEEFNDGRPEMHEEEHTEELDKIISDLNQGLEKFLAGYGVSSIKLPPANVHVLDWSRLSSETAKKIKENFVGISGFYNAKDHRIRMLVKFVEGEKMHFIKTLIHEMLHLNSFVSLEKMPPEYSGPALEIINASPEGDKILKLGTRRVGFTVKVADTENSLYFNLLDEAIIETLTKKFSSEYAAKAPEIEDEYRELQSMIAAAGHVVADSEGWDKIRDDISHLPAGSSVSETLSFGRYAYSKQRAILEDLVDNLYFKNQTDFSSREDVFNLFARATLKGELLPVARLIEKTFGKGSFRELGEKMARKKLSAGN